MNPSIKTAIINILLLWACLGILAVSAYACVNYGLVQTISRDWLEVQRDYP